jgi:hypothetical protein
VSDLTLPVASVREMRMWVVIVRFELHKITSCRTSQVAEHHKLQNITNCRKSQVAQNHKLQKVMR